MKAKIVIGAIPVLLGFSPRSGVPVRISAARGKHARHSRSWMKPFPVVVLSVALAIGLPAGSGADENAGMFRGEGVDFAVKYYAGGVGHSPENEAAEKASEYSVRVLFAALDRSLLSNVGLVVTDIQGRVVFRIDGTEPVIYLGLPKGIYAFEGSYHGSTRRHQRIVVDPGSRRDVVFVFPE